MNSTLPDIVTALLVYTVVGEVHELVFDVLHSMVILHSSKSTNHTKE